MTVQAKTVTVQAVAAAIRVTKGVSRSHKYASSSRNIRSTGVYTQKDWKGRVTFDYWSNGYKYLQDSAESELALVTETLQAKGYKVTTVIEPGYLGNQTKRIVEVAE